MTAERFAQLLQTMYGLPVVETDKSYMVGVRHVYQLRELLQLANDLGVEHEQTATIAPKSLPTLYAFCVKKGLAK